MALFNAFFHGNISAFEKVCLRSFVDHGHDVTFFSFDRSDCPSFCRWVDAARVMDQSCIYFYEDGVGKGSVSAFSNLFRYKILQSFDGYWIDTDVVCVSDDWPDEPFVAGWQSESEINGAVLKFERDHPALQEMIEACLLHKGKGEWGATGPRKITEMFKKYDLLNYTKDRSCFYEINWIDFELFLRVENCSEIFGRTKDSLAIHLWNEMFRRSGVNKNKRPPAGSFLWEVAVRHGMLDCFRD